jgi:predicted PurR-regulated permease PerM
VLTAFVDALPLLGCGTVLIPWAAWCFLSGEAIRGAGLLILLGVIYIVRQFLEPRVIGKMTGVHPFVALASVYVGLKLGGVSGMIVAPIILMCVNQYTHREGGKK